MAKGKKSDKHANIPRFTDSAEQCDTRDQHILESVHTAKRTTKSISLVTESPRSNLIVARGIPDDIAAAQRDILIENAGDDDIGVEKLVSSGLRSYRRRHRKSVDESGEGIRYVCKICERPFRRIEHLRRHEATHTGTRSHKCPICESAFYRGDILVRHMRNVHGANVTGVKEIKKKSEAAQNILQEGLSHDRAHVEHSSTETFQVQPLQNEDKSDCEISTMENSMGNPSYLYTHQQTQTSLPFEFVDKSHQNPRFMCSTSSNPPLSSHSIPNKHGKHLIYAPYGPGHSYHPYGAYKPVTASNDSQRNLHMSPEQLPQSQNVFPQIPVSQESGEYQAYISSFPAMYSHVNSPAGGNLFQRSHRQGDSYPKIGEGTTSLHLPQHYLPNYMAYHPPSTNPNQFTRCFDGMTHTNPSMQTLIAYGYGPYSPNSAELISPMHLVPRPESNNSAEYIARDSMYPVPTRHVDTPLQFGDKSVENKNLRFPGSEASSSILPAAEIEPEGHMSQAINDGESIDDKSRIDTSVD